MYKLTVNVIIVSINYALHKLYDVWDIMYRIALLALG